MKDGTLTKLEQDIRIKNTRRVSADFRADKNETKITDKIREEGEKSVTKITKAGIVILQASSLEGVFGVRY